MEGLADSLPQLGTGGQEDEGRDEGDGILGEEEEVAGEVVEGTVDGGEALDDLETGEDWGTGGGGDSRRR